MSSAVSVTLTKRKEVAAGTMAFHFEKPQGFTFKAGQYVSLTIIDPPETDAKGSTRTFSIASAPEEAEIMISTRMRDTAFKRVFKTMKLGTQVTMEGPWGNLVLHGDPFRPAVFLAGGIGVTPFRSIVLSAAHAKLSHHLFLFYSNRRPEDAAFLDELSKCEEKNSTYKFIGTMTEMEKSSRSWGGETGRVGKEMLLRYLPDLKQPIYYAAGPPAMVFSMQEMLTEAGVSDESIRSEEFYGY